MRGVASAPSFTNVAPARKAIWEGEVHVVTPMFGGSATAGEVDPDRPVNAKMIRGHLRFWWRACKAGKFSSAKEMFEEETKFWGSTETPSAVDVVVQIKNTGQPVACATYGKRRDGTYKSVPDFRSGYPAYALFPFQGKLDKDKSKIEVEPAEAYEGVRFLLSLSSTQSNGRLPLDAIETEVKAALWAWLLFGGVGARTRRGCGSLYVAGWPFSGLDQDPLGPIQSEARVRIQQSGSRLPIPSLKGAGLLVGAEALGHLDAWSGAVNKMKDFRQAVGFARNPGQQPNRPGRSRWPEADSIRRIANKSAPAHQPNHPAAPFFPRADLGMPIVFHYQHPQDPPDHILGPTEEGKTRMASPIILKPLAATEKQGYPMALKLTAPHAWDSDAPTPHIGRQTLNPSELSDSSKLSEVPPLAQLANRPVREAFMVYFKQKTNAKEVTL